MGSNKQQQQQSEVWGCPPESVQTMAIFVWENGGVLAQFTATRRRFFFNKDICSGFSTPQSLGFQIHTSLAFFNNQDGISFKILDLVCVERNTQKGENRYGGFRAHKVSADGLIGGEAM